MALAFIGFAFVKRLNPWKDGIELWGIAVVSLAAVSAFVGQATEFLGEHDPHQVAVFAPAAIVSAVVVIAFATWLIRKQRLSKAKDHGSGKHQGHDA